MRGKVIRQEDREAPNDLSKNLYAENVQNPKIIIHRSLKCHSKYRNTTRRHDAEGGTPANKTGKFMMMHPRTYRLLTDSITGTSRKVFRPFDARSDACEGPPRGAAVARRRSEGPYVEVILRIFVAASPCEGERSQNFDRRGRRP